VSALAVTERLAEAAGPIVVKEIRQGLRARVFAIFFGLLLLACLVVALVAAADFDTAANRELGPDYFRLFLYALAVVEFFVIPYTAFRAMAREREDETWVLLALTGLGPRRIVRGKVTSALAQGLLYASACAPFVLFSYYLNGIALPTVLVALVMAAAWSTLLVCVAVAAATQAHSRIGRALTHFLTLFVLLGATVLGVAFANVLAEEGSRLLREESGFRAFCAAVFTWSLTTGWVLSEGAASGLCLISENSARGPRLALAVQMVLGVAVGASAALLIDAREGALVGSVCTSLQLVLAGGFAVSERDGFPPAFANGAVWLKPGALRSFLLITALIVVCTLVWATVFQSGTGNRTVLRPMLAGPLYVVLYLSLGVLAGRVTPLRKLSEPIATRVGFVTVTALGSAVPPFIALLMRRETNDLQLNMLNPLVGMVNHLDGSRHAYSALRASATGLPLLGAAALLAAFAAWTVLSSRDVERRT
jgi:ABC-type transport system involved in multi-copper enzyme maturation permease subunit